MKIVLHDRLGRPEEVLRLEDRASQSPGPGEVRARILATPVHPSDLLRIAGHYGAKATLPAIPGTEAAVRIEEVGQGVDGFGPGDMGLIIGGEGTWRSEITLPAERVVPAPEGDPEQIAMAAANPITAWILLHDYVALSPGDWIIQSGANSAVGQYVIRLAREMGVRTINIVRREGLARTLTEMGADVVLTDGPDLPGRIGEATKGAPVRLALDCVAGDVFGRLLASVETGGTVVAYGAMSNEPAVLDPAATIYGEKTIKGFWLVRWFREVDAKTRAETFARLLSMVADGRLRAEVDARFSLEEIGEAVARAKEKRRGGKVLLVPNAT